MNFCVLICVMTQQCKVLYLFLLVKRTWEKQLEIIRELSKDRFIRLNKNVKRKQKYNKNRTIKNLQC